jgi:hypothetical protein
MHVKIEGEVIGVDVTLSVSTPGKLKTLLDCGGNRTRDLGLSKTTGP